MGVNFARKGANTSELMRTAFALIILFYKVFLKIRELARKGPDQFRDV